LGVNVGHSIVTNGDLLCSCAKVHERSRFDSCVESSQYFRTDNISLETSVRWLSKDVVSFKIEVWVYEKFAKM